MVLTDLRQVMNFYTFHLKTELLRCIHTKTYVTQLDLAVTPRHRLTKVLWRPSIGNNWIVHLLGEILQNNIYKIPVYLFHILAKSFFLTRDIIELLLELQLLCC
jgi:hypothetical protein